MDTFGCIWYRDACCTMQKVLEDVLVASTCANHNGSVATLSLLEISMPLGAGCRGLIPAPELGQRCREVLGHRCLGHNAEKYTYRCSDKLFVDVWTAFPFVLDQLEVGG